MANATIKITKKVNIEWNREDGEVTVNVNHSLKKGEWFLYPEIEMISVSQLIRDGIQKVSNFIETGYSPGLGRPVRSGYYTLKEKILFSGKEYREEAPLTEAVLSDVKKQLQNIAEFYSYKNRIIN